MKKRFFWLVLSCIMVISMLLASCGTKTTQTTTSMTTITMTTKQTTITTTVQTTKTTTSTQSASTPQYGGTFTYRINTDPSHFDPYYLSAGNAQTVQKLFLETLCEYDLTVDRNIFDFKTSYLPMKYVRGALAESWEISNSQTATLHIRKGIHWQDKPPANGRELTAYDIEYLWHRQLGLGSGYTELNPYLPVEYKNIQSVTATDKWTIVFNCKQPVLQIPVFGNGYYGHIVNREAVEKWEYLDDWRNAIGTGPFILTDYVSGSSVTGVKNPNYWGYDEIYPDNKLPYFDVVKILIIPDIATALAAVRSGKIDLIEDITWQQAKSLEQTNPILKQVTRPLNSDAIVLMVDKKPFDDIRVRKALQMSIDLKTIAQSFYGGTVEATPMGLLGIKGFYTPFENWPKEVQDGYIYNPNGAKKLLAEAGYSNGFKTVLTTSSATDLDLWQIIKAYFLDIGVDMEIQVMDPAALSAWAAASKHVMLGTSGTSGTLFTYPPLNALNARYSGHKRAYSWGHVKDPVYDELRIKASLTLDEEEFRQLVNQADDYNIAQQWIVNILVKNGFCVNQPWLNGFNGEIGFAFGQLFGRMWRAQK